jgi:hypothetical protein
LTEIFITQGSVKNLLEVRSSSSQVQSTILATNQGDIVKNQHLKPRPLLYSTKKIISNKDYETTDDFRRIQEESNRTSNNETQLYHRGSERISNESRRTLATTYEGLLTRNSGTIS